MNREKVCLKAIIVSLTLGHEHQTARQDVQVKHRTLLTINVHCIRLGALALLMLGLLLAVSTVQSKESFGSEISFDAVPSGWERFRDPYWNFEIAYPSTWRLQNLPYRDFGFRISSPDSIVNPVGQPLNGAFLSVNTSLMSLEEWEKYVQLQSPDGLPDLRGENGFQWIHTEGTNYAGQRYIQEAWHTGSHLTTFHFVDTQRPYSQLSTGRWILESITVLGPPTQYPEPDYASLGIDLASFSFPPILHAFQAGDGRIIADTNASWHYGGDDYALDLCEGGSCQSGVIGQYVIAPTRLTKRYSGNYNDITGDADDFHIFEIDNNGTEKLCMSLGHVQIRLSGFVNGTTVPRGAAIGTLMDYPPSVEHIHMGIWVIASSLSCVSEGRTAVAFASSFTLDGENYYPTQSWVGEGVTSTNYPVCAPPTSGLQTSPGMPVSDPGDCFGSDPSCPAPSLIEPADNASLANRDIIFRWNALNGSACQFSGYTFRVCTSPDVNNSGNCFINRSIGGTEQAETITGRDNTDLWWGVKAANAPNGSEWAVREFRIDPGQPPTGTWKAKYYDTIDKWNDDSNNGNFRCETQIPGVFLDKGFGTGAECGMDGDGWTGDFTQTINFPAGNYVFYVSHDDGLRLWVGNNKIHEEPYEKHNYFVCPPRSLSGNVDVRVMLREDGGDADVAVSWSTDTSPCDDVTPPKPDLHPFTPNGWEYPVVPNSSAQPTRATTTLYAGGYPGRDVMTFFDWAFTNSGSGTANGDFHVEVRIDDTWFIRYPYRDVGPGGGASWENWMHPVLTAGQHVLKIVVDPDNRIDESNENNNEWQHTFNWQPISGWYAEYYSNESLTWPPEVVRDDAEINFSWPGSPAPNIPANGFSVRWARTDNFSAGTYRFSGYQDDGARVQIDGTTYYEDWTHPRVRSFTFDKALTPGQHTVMFEMYEHNGGAEAELSWELLAPTVPGIPSHISPSNNAVFNRNDNITLTWSTSSNASRYMAQIIADPDFVRESGWTSGTSWNVGQLSGGLYAWRIRAESSAGFSSDWSSTRLFTVKYDRPTSLTATAASSSQINLSWSASGDAPNNLDGYRIYRDGSAIATVSSAATTYANTGLSCETGYTYVVRAYKGSVESDASNSASATTTSCSLAAPDVNPIYNPDSDGTFRIVWSAFPGATWYVAEQRRDNGAWEPSYSGDGEWYEVTDYSVGEWCFRVQAITATATSPWSTIVCTQVGDVAEPPGIPILSAISNPDQANSYWVSWTNVSGAAEYELQGQWNLGAWSNVYSGSSVSYYASGQTEGTWCYRVQASNSVGTSGWSDMACTSVQRLTYPYNVYIVSIMK